MARRHRARAADASRKLQEAAGQIRDDKIKEKLRYSRQFLGRDAEPGAGAELEADIGTTSMDLRRRAGVRPTAVGKGDSAAGGDAARERPGAGTGTARGVDSLGRRMQERATGAERARSAGAARPTAQQGSRRSARAAGPARSTGSAGPARATGPGRVSRDRPASRGSKANKARPDNRASRGRKARAASPGRRRPTTATAAAATATAPAAGTTRRRLGQSPSRRLHPTTTSASSAAKPAAGPARTATACASCCAAELDTTRPRRDPAPAEGARRRPRLPRRAGAGAAAGGGERRDASASSSACAARSGRRRRRALVAAANEVPAEFRKHGRGVLPQPGPATADSRDDPTAPVGCGHGAGSDSGGRRFRANSNRATGAAGGGSRRGFRPARRLRRRLHLLPADVFQPVARGRRPGLVHRLSRRRHQLLDPFRRVDQDAGHPAAQRRAQPLGGARH